jgi:hypothetical protein
LLHSTPLLDDSLFGIYRGYDTCSVMARSYCTNSLPEYMPILPFNISSKHATTPLTPVATVVSNPRRRWWFDNTPPRLVTQVLTETLTSKKATVGNKTHNPREHRSRSKRGITTLVVTIPRIANENEDIFNTLVFVEILLFWLPVFRCLPVLQTRGVIGAASVLYVFTIRQFHDWNTWYTPQGRLPT